jgi:hypothetical protein
MPRTVGQTLDGIPLTWLVRAYNGHLKQATRIGLRDAQPHINKMLGGRERGRNFGSPRASSSYEKTEDLVGEFIRTAGAAPE